MKDRFISVCLVLWLMLAPVRPAMTAVIILPLVDLALALICAIRAHRKLTSAGFKRTVAKIAMYELAVVLAFVVETWLTGPIVPAIKGVSGLIGITELKSCLEHLDELNGQPFFKAMLSKLSRPQSNKEEDR